MKYEYINMNCTKHTLYCNITVLFQRALVSYICSVLLASFAGSWISHKSNTEGANETHTREAEPCKRYSLIEFTPSCLSLEPSS